MEPYAKVIADSTYLDGYRLTTMEVRFHRFVLAEFNTHRVFSRNSASSRAIPVAKQLARVREDPAVPLSWPAEQKGMQGGAEHPEESSEALKAQWLQAAKSAARVAESLSADGLHKSVTNRLLEPFMSHTVVVTSTAWENFFEQRCSPLAQPEIRAVAELMREAYNNSEPKILKSGEWHVPYIQKGEALLWEDAVRISAARCARVSYLTQSGEHDPDADLALYERLTTAQPAHWSPLEHVATPWYANRQRGIMPFNPLLGKDGHPYAMVNHLPKVGNLLGWRSLRTEVEADRGEMTFS